jgi:hypothetical protein
VAALILLSNADGFFDFTFLETPSDGRGKFPGLLSSSAKGKSAVNHHSDGPRRHQSKNNYDGAGQPAHLLPHGNDVETDFLQEHQSENI